MEVLILWTTIYVSIDFKNIKQVEMDLKTEGFLVRLNRAIDEEADSLYELSVLENEVMDAREYLMEKGII
jgi:hypothetical protein